MLFSEYKLMDILLDFLKTSLLTARDLLPIVILFGFFQFFVLKQQLPNIRRILAGLLYVYIGLSLFLTGLEKALFLSATSWLPN